MWLAASGLMVIEFVSGLSLAQWYMQCSVKMDFGEGQSKMDSGRTYELASPLSCRPFLNSSRWLGLVSSVFFTRISCSKITHANCHLVLGQVGGFSPCFPEQKHLGKSLDFWTGQRGE